MQVILNEQVAERKFGVIEIEMSQGIAKYQWEMNSTQDDFELIYNLISDPMPDENITEAEATEIDTLIKDTVI